MVKLLLSFGSLSSQPIPFALLPVGVLHVASRKQSLLIGKGEMLPFSQLEKAVLLRAS